MDFKNVFLSFRHCCGSALVSVRIRIQLFISMRIRILSDPDLERQTLPSRKVELSHENMGHLSRYGYKTYPLRYNYKSLFEMLECLFVNFGKFLYSWIRIRVRIPNTDPDPGEPNHCESGYTRLFSGNGAAFNSLLCCPELDSFCSTTSSFRGPSGTDVRSLKSVVVIDNVLHSF